LTTSFPLSDILIIVLTPRGVMALLNYGHFVAPPTVPAWQVAAGALAWIATLAALSVAIIGRIRYESPELLRAEM
jgi:hypothetical protein